MPKRLPNPPYKISLVDFFEEEPCWDWLGAIRGGYGTITNTSKGYKCAIQATRVIWEKLVGVIPAGKHLDHKCRRKICVNPKHLEPVTNQINCQRGDMAILTEDQARQIKILSRQKGTNQGDIAKQFNISQSTVSAIKLGRLWSNICV